LNLEKTYKMEKIAAIVVTYNKKELLINAVNGILNQELLPDKLVIVDNCSNDGTPECLLKNLWINELPLKILDKNVISSKCLILKNGNKVEIDYIRKFENDGGAGGFYQGMKYAYELGFDWLWLMDDDGVPEKRCLQELYKSKEKNIVSGPLVIDIETQKTASFIFDEKNRNNLALTDVLKKKDVLENVLNPFNGTFISKTVIDKVGFVKREMFIWGDEAEYQSRIIKNGFKVQTITKAIHRHPINKKKPKYNSKLFKFTIFDIQNPIFMFIFFRNYTYLNKENNYSFSKKVKFYRVVYEIIINAIYNFLRGDFNRARLCLLSIKKGYLGDFNLPK